MMVLSLFLGSVVYVSYKLRSAQQARRIFITRFPEYTYLSWQPFLHLSPTQVRHQLDILTAVQNDPDWQALHLSPLDFLHGARKQ